MTKSQRSDPFDFNGTLCVVRDNVGQLTVDRSTAHGLTEIHSDPSALIEHDAAAPDDRDADDGAPMLTSIAGGAR